MGKKGKNGANKKLHNKLVRRKKTREMDSKESRKRLMRKLNKKAGDASADSAGLEEE